MAEDSTRRPLLLLVEDNPEDERLALRALRRTGIEIEAHVARDGEEAVQTAERLAPTPINLILLDLKLPKRSGLEVLQHLRNYPLIEDVPILMLTSSDEPRDVSACLGAGANEYIQKPIDYERYMDVVPEAVRRWLSEASLA